MMLVGRIAKEAGPWWSAEVAAIGVYTQGKSRKDAAAMIADAIELLVDREGFKVEVTELGEDGDGVLVHVAANEPAALAAHVLKNQREEHGMTLADVQKKLGAASINAYAAYEQGKREPSLSKYMELLAAVAPELMLTVGPRKPPATEEVGVPYERHRGIQVGEVHPLDDRDQRAPKQPRKTRPVSSRTRSVSGANKPARSS